MKNFILIIIVFLFCYIGFLIKDKYKKQKVLLEEIKLFVEYFKANMIVFNNNLVDIIGSYKIIQNNKNALSNKLFQNNEF